MTFCLKDRIIIENTMNLIRTVRRVLIRNICFLVMLGLTGCTSRPSLPITPTISPSVVVADTQHPEVATTTSQTILGVTATPISPKTNNIELTPIPSKTIPSITATPIQPGAITKKILLLVSEDLGSTFSRDSIWIKSPGESLPNVLIQDQDLSFERPAWSHDGKWIAYIQSDWPNKSSFQVGIIDVGGAQRQVLPENYGAVGEMNWSVNDDKLVFDTPSSPFVLDVDTGEILDLWPESDNFEGETKLKLSPRYDFVAFAEFTQEQGTEVNLWLLSLDGRSRDRIQLPEEIIGQCRSGLTTLEWSPDGESILVQFRGWPWEECEPQLWLFNLAERKWLSVAHLPKSMINYYYDYNAVGHASWSRDGSWVIWETTRSILIFDVDDAWNMTRKIDFGISDSPLAFPWVKDINGRTILTINRADITDNLRIPIAILGISPNGTIADDKEILRIEADPNWLPNNSIFTPLFWEP
jgi:Tol biopolymer transport system component